MSINNIINTSLTGLQTSQTALRATSNNIANVNTEGYARLSAVQEANVLQGETAGVRIRGIERVVDQFLETALINAGSATSEYQIQREFHDRLQGILGNPDSEASLSARIDDIFSAVADLALNPSDVLRRSGTLSEMQSFFDQINVLQSQVQSLRADTSSQMVEKIGEVNALLQSINELNPLIVRQQNLGGETGGLENQMALNLKELAELVDINVVRQTDGQTFVYTNSGQSLVDSSLSQLSYDSPGIVTAGTVFPDIEIYRADPDTLQQMSTGTDLTSSLRSGELKGLVTMRDQQFPDLSLTLGELAARVRDEINAIHNQYTAVPAPQQLTGKQTFVDGGHNTGFTGIVNFSVIDSTGAVVDTAQVDFDGAPPADMDALITQVNTALTGNATMALTNGVLTLTASSSANGVIIADDPTTPTDRAGRGFSHFFGMNDLVDADQEGIFETGVDLTDDHNIAGGSMNFRVLDVAGREIASVTANTAGSTFNDMLGELNSLSGMGIYFTFSYDSNGQLGWTTNPPYEGLKLQLVADSTDIGGTGVGFGKAFGLGDQYRADAARDMMVDEVIMDDPTRMALSVYDTTATVGNVAVTTGDQRGALALQELETTLVDFNRAGEMQASNVTLSQYVARFLGNAGLMAKRAEGLESDNQALQTELFQRVSDVSGVNMDEELANLVVYQNSYNAAARVLSSVQELYDSLLNAV